MLKEIGNSRKATAAKLTSMAVQLADANRLHEAIDVLRRVVRLSPDTHAHNNLGFVLLRSGALSEALGFLRLAIAQDPTLAVGWQNLGDCLAGTGDLSEALNAYDRCLKINPQQPSALVNAGNAWRRLGKPDRAKELYATAIKLAPSFVPALRNLGCLLFAQGDPNPAIECLRRAIDANPSDCGAHFELAGMLRACNALDEALTHCLESCHLDSFHMGAVARAINLMQRLCLWDAQMDALQEKLTRNFDSPLCTFPASPFEFLGLHSETSPGQQLACAARFSLEYEVVPLVKRAVSAASSQRMKIGYLSADFHDHATMYLLGDLFAHHDRNRFEIFAYSTGEDDGGTMRQRAASGVDTFADLRALSDEEAAQRIANDGIDILVDLKGYTMDARPSIIRRRPAPAQVNWLGYPGSMGCADWDFIFTDNFITPLGAERNFAEQVVRLPGCYQVNDRFRPLPPGSSRTEDGLPQGAVVLASFNQPYKISQAVFAVWMEVLRMAPNAVLWLFASHAQTQTNLRKRAEGLGVDPCRLHFANPLPLRQHLARYRNVDLCLDTYPVTSHTTASDALWMASPLITCTGETFASRVAGSLLHAVGLPQLVCDSLDAYRILALRLVRSPADLLALRMKLEAGRANCELFDTPAFARKLERAYEHIWHSCQRELASGIAP